jgi:phosphatidate cytidylyltransferase
MAQSETLIRVCAALVMVPLFVASLLGLSSDGLGWVLLVVVGVAGAEWGRLLGVESRAVSWMCGAFAVVVIGALWNVLSVRALAVASSVLATVWWLGAGVWLVARRSAPPIVIEPWSMPARLVHGSLALLILTATWSAVIGIHADPRLGPAFVLAMFVCVWSADSGAYFVGRVLGRHKLAPAISPGKSVEGFVGGVVAAAVAGLIFALWLNFGRSTLTPVSGLLGWIILAAGVGAISVVGDLFESWLKRRAGVKDSGHIIPGHGGVLDRIDGVMPGAALFAVVLLLGFNHE